MHSRCNVLHGRINKHRALTNDVNKSRNGLIAARSKTLASLFVLYIYIFPRDVCMCAEKLWCRRKSETDSVKTVGKTTSSHLVFQSLTHVYLVPIQFHISEKMFDGIIVIYHGKIRFAWSEQDLCLFISLPFNFFKSLWPECVCVCVCIASDQSHQPDK